MHYSHCLLLENEFVNTKSNSSLDPKPTPFFCSSVSVDNNTWMRPSASVYYCQRKPKNRKKNGVGLGSRLVKFTADGYSRIAFSLFFLVSFVALCFCLRHLCCLLILASLCSTEFTLHALGVNCYRQNSSLRALVWGLLMLAQLHFLQFDKSSHLPG